MQALLLIAHGSRRHESNQEVFELVDALKQKLNSRFDILQACFLELCEPSIGDAIDKLVANGALDITVMPYFLNQGRHVTEDVPHEIMVKQSQYPNLTIKTLPYIGMVEEITDFLVKVITAEH